LRIVFADLVADQSIDQEYARCLADATVKFLAVPFEEVEALIDERLGSIPRGLPIR